MNKSSTNSKHIENFKYITISPIYANYIKKMYNLITNYSDEQLSSYVDSNFKGSKIEYIKWRDKLYLDFQYIVDVEKSNSEYMKQRGIISLR